MKNKIAFFKEFLKNPKEVGSITPSSTFLTNSIVKNIDFNKYDLIIYEYGPGLGTFSDKIIFNLKPNHKLVIIENSPYFFEKLNKKYQHLKNVIVVFDSVSNIIDIKNKLNHKYIDYIISGIPFSSLNKHLTENILNNTKLCMNDKSLFVTFQYSFFRKRFFDKYFNNIVIDKNILNIPPAFIFKMKI